MYIYTDTFWTLISMRVAVYGACWYERHAYVCLLRQSCKIEHDMQVLDRHEVKRLNHARNTKFDRQHDMVLESPAGTDTRNIHIFLG